MTLKFTFTALILLAVFGLWQGLSPLNPILTAAVLTGIAYVIGDTWVLPNFGNRVATAIDVPLAGVTIWAVQLVLAGFGVSLNAVGLAALLSGAAEWFYHRYLETTGRVDPPPPL